MKLEKIIEIVCRHREISPETIQLKIRVEQIKTTRQIVHYFARHSTELGLRQIGQLVGSVSHATVIHSHRTILNYIEYDKRFAEQIRRIEMELSVAALKAVQPKASMSTYEERKQEYFANYRQ